MAKLNDIIEVELGDITIKGFICSFHPRDITVEMTYPFNGLQRGLHIPLLGGNNINTFDGNYGLKTARSLLIELYADILHITDTL
ncbi:hypothetical protein [Pedobacter sp.]